MYLATPLRLTARFRGAAGAPAYWVSVRWQAGVARLKSGTPGSRQAFCFQSGLHAARELTLWWWRNSVSVSWDISLAWQSRVEL